jgi:pSer/pThr/pTyr-binding forkhead associated (FHA) protein
MALSLVVLAAGKQQGQVLQVKPLQFLVGRDPGCHLRPASHLIGDRHCAIRQRHGKAFLRDLASTGGTSVNGRPVQGEVDLPLGDRLRIMLTTARGTPRRPCCLPRRATPVTAARAAPGATTSHGRERAGGRRGGPSFP